MGTWADADREVRAWLQGLGGTDGLQVEVVDVVAPPLPRPDLPAEGGAALRYLVTAAPGTAALDQLEAVFRASVHHPGYDVAVGAPPAELLGALHRPRQPALALTVPLPAHRPDAPLVTEPLRLEAVLTAAGDGPDEREVDDGDS